MRHSRGAALFMTFLLMLVLAGLGLAVGVHSHNSITGARASLQDRQAFYVAGAGLQRARQALVAGTWAAAASPGNSYTESFPPSNPVGEYEVTVVDDGGGEYTVTAEGYVPSQSAAVSRRRITVEAIAVTSSSGTNYATSATASASSVNGTNTADKANDGLTSTKWQAGSNGNGWLAMDFGSARSLNQIVVKEDVNVTGVTIEYSTNGSSWTSAGASVVESPSKTWTATFSSASYRYFRASVSAASSKKPSVKEMECYSSAISALGDGEMTSQW